MLTFFLGVVGTKAWKRYIGENSNLAGAGADVIAQALAQIKL
jgi:hypothetical protein